MRVALVTGANGGFGKLITVELIRSGFFVIAAMRNLDKQAELLNMVNQMGWKDNLQLVKMDVTSDAEIEKVYALIKEQHQKLDVLINNAGYSQGGFVEDLSMDEWQNQMDTNVMGVIRTTRQFLPLLKCGAKGQIINISSVSGYFGFPGMGPYCSSKFAVEGFSESLRMELLQEGIYVSLVEPASFKTGIWEKGLEIGSTFQEDTQMKWNALKYARNAYRNAGNPLEVAMLVHKICHTKQPRFRYQIGKGARSLWLIKKIIPWSIIEKTVLRNLSNQKKIR